MDLLQKREAWEAEKTEEDMEKYVWERSKSKDTVVKLLQTTKDIDQVSKTLDMQKLGLWWKPLMKDHPKSQYAQ